MRLDDTPSVQLSDLVTWLDHLSKTSAPSKEVWQEIALSAQEHAQFLDNYVLPKVANPAQHWNPNGNEGLGNGAAKVEILRGRGPRTEGLMTDNGVSGNIDVDEGVGQPFELPAR